MSHGAPVASSSATSLPEIYGNAALYFNPTDVDDMAKVIKRLLTKPDLRKDLIKAGYKQAGKYSWTKMAEQTLDIYKLVLGEH
jgi:glycosyltransferase involved in cell wall biosynthesis